MDACLNRTIETYIKGGSRRVLHNFIVIPTWTLESNSPSFSLACSSSLRPSMPSASVSDPPSFSGCLSLEGFRVLTGVHGYMLVPRSVTWFLVSFSVPGSVPCQHGMDKGTEKKGRSPCRSLTAGTEQHPFSEPCRSPFRSRKERE